jgi:serine/threonine-protein kinase
LTDATHRNAPDLVASRYRVLEAIGEGGMGQVYLAVDETLKRQVALKAIRAEQRLNPEAKARFVREARVLSQLDHSHICRVFDYLETPDSDWIVLELIEGQTLRDAMRRDLPWARRLSVARQIADVLVVTHAAGVVHRDLKPGNVMVTNSGDIKVLDFGLSATLPPAGHTPEHAAAAAVDAVPDPAALAETWSPGDGTRPPSRPISVSQFNSDPGSVKGTVAYMSPEQARGEPLTTASDMYSFGLLLQELFSGQPPYGDTKDYVEILGRAQRGDSLPPAGVPATVRGLVTRLKSMAPAQRPTAVDASERLQWIADRPRRLRRNIGIAALAVIAIAGAVRYTIDLSRERNAAIAAREEADKRRGQAEGLIGFMVGDLRTRLAAVGRLEILDEVGTQALAYFASVPADTLTDEELYRRSQALHQLGQVRQARADLDGALKAYEESLAQAQEVVRRSPDNPTWQLGLGTSHFYVGDVKMRRNELADALTHFLAYKDIAERLAARDPSNFEWKLEQSYGHSNVAAIYQRQGHLPAARDELLKVAALQIDLAARKPDDLALQASRANNHNRLAIIQDGLGELEAAAATFAKELELYASILARTPQDTRIRRRLEVSHIFRSHVLRALGRTEDAGTHLAAAVSEAEALVALDPTNANWQRDLGVALLAAARIDLDQGRTRQALDRFRSALERFEPLSRKSPVSGEAVRDLAKANVGLGDAFLAAGDLAAAFRHADAARVSLQALADKQPRDVDARRDLAIAENTNGLVWKARGNMERAAAAWSHGQSLIEPLARDSRDRVVLEPWARSLIYLGRADEARVAHERLLALGFREPGYLRLKRP